MLIFKKIKMASENKNLYRKIESVFFCLFFFKYSIYIIIPDSNYFRKDLNKNSHHMKVGSYLCMIFGLKFFFTLKLFLWHLVLLKTTKIKARVLYSIFFCNASYVHNLMKLERKKFIALHVTNRLATD